MKCRKDDNHHDYPWWEVPPKGTDKRLEIAILVVNALTLIMLLLKLLLK